MKKTTLLIPVLAGLLALPACGARDASSSEAEADSGGSGDLTVAIISGYPPLGYQEDGELVGLDVDLTRAIGEKMGEDIEVTQQSFENMLLGVDRGAYAFVPAVNVTAERGEKYDFVTYLKSGYGFGDTRGKSADIKEQSDVCGLKVAALSGDQSVDTMRAWSKECTENGDPEIDLTTFPDAGAAVIAMESGRADVVTQSTLNLSQVAANESDWTLSELEYQLIETAFAFPKGSDLAPEVAKAVEELMADGTYEEIFEKYNVDPFMIDAPEINPEPLQ